MGSIYSVIWTNVAENDFKDIIEYISIENPQNALNVFQKIKQNVSDLYTLPERGRIVPELQDHGILQYRELIIPPWRLIYRTAGLEIYVLSVIDSRQNVEDILFKRLVDQKEFNK